MRRIETPKPWQIEATQLGRPAQYFMSQAPGSSGKFLLQVMLAQADVEDTGNKQLILVPKRGGQGGSASRSEKSWLSKDGRRSSGIAFGQQRWWID